MIPMVCACFLFACWWELNWKPSYRPVGESFVRFRYLLPDHKLIGWFKFRKHFISGEFYRVRIVWRMQPHKPLTWMAQHHTAVSVWSAQIPSRLQICTFSITCRSIVFNCNPCIMKNKFGIFDTIIQPPKEQEIAGHVQAEVCLQSHNHCGSFCQAATP